MRPILILSALLLAFFALPGHHTAAAVEIALIEPAIDANTPGSEWRYLDDGSNQGTAWRHLNFDDDAWKQGGSELGYGDGDEATVIEFGPDPKDKFITTYFRKTFRIADKSEVKALTLYLLRDDGAVVYLNGDRIVRSNMPKTYTYLTRASNVVGNDGETTYHTYDVSPSKLTNGENIIAVEVHQQNPKSSDLSFDMELIAEVNMDANLAAALRDAIGMSPQSSEPIPAAELAELWAFTANNKGISHLTGIGFCSNMQELYFSDNNLSDIGPLEHLTLLVDLGLKNNPGITDLSPIADLPSLDFLHVKGTSLSPASCGIVFDLKDLGATVFSDCTQRPEPPSAFIATGSEWRYLDNGSNQGTN